MLTRAQRREQQKEEYDRLYVVLFQKQRGLCAHCGRRVPQLDRSHRIARGMGGGFRKDTEGNLELVCRSDHQERPYELSKWNGEERK